MRNVLDYISTYSQIWDRQRKINDMQDILKYSTQSIEQINSCIHSYNSKSFDDVSFDLDSDSLQNGSDLNIKYSIKNLPKDVHEILKQIDDVDFNIFDLNQRIGKKTLPIISISIFKALGYFGTIINESSFFEYIKEINNGYDRKMAYHNVIYLFIYSYYN